MTPKIRFQAVQKRFDAHGAELVAIRDVTLDVAAGEFIAIVGPSGCGKSTLLNMVAGLMRPSAGTVEYDGSPVTAVNTRLGYVTQRDNLLPWRTVKANVGMALEIKGVRKAERVRRVDAILEQVGLSAFKNHYPAELSGGMRKRVTLARTLIYEPETLVMDEPFGALDAQLRQLLHEELLNIWNRSRMTVLFVTHDLEEAITLADRVVSISARPGTIRSIIDVDLPRPRDVFGVRFTSRFAELHQKLWESIESDLRAGTEV